MAAQTWACLDCDGQGEVPTAETAHLAQVSVGGFPHPSAEFRTCGTCEGTGAVAVTGVVA